MAEPFTKVRNARTIHFSVGALIEEGGKLLLIDRAQKPFGWASPAGHIDKSETPLKAIKREVMEETGLEVTKASLVIEEFVAWNECSRGIKGHYWYVFRCQVKGQLKSSSEAKSIGWHKAKDAQPLEPVWEYWFKKLELL